MTNAPSLISASFLLELPTQSLCQTDSARYEDALLISGQGGMPCLALRLDNVLGYTHKA